MTKVKITYGPPSRFSCIFSLRHLFKTLHYYVWKSWYIKLCLHYYSTLSLEGLFLRISVGMSYRAKTIDFLGYFYTQVQKKSFINWIFFKFRVNYRENSFNFIKYGCYRHYLVFIAFQLVMSVWQKHFLKASRHSV